MRAGNVDISSKLSAACRYRAAGAVLLAAGLLGGCGSLQGASFLPPVFHSWTASPVTPKPPRPGARASARASGAATGSVEIVERSLRERGLRFGTDGTPEALYAYVRF